jgi:membrane protease YdiL (CAAX protease family)
VSQQSVSRKALTTFLVLTLASSAVYWWIIIANGGLTGRGGVYVFWLMWAPGMSALVTRFVYQRNVRGEGWSLRPWRWLLVGYLVPIAYATVAYAAVWTLRLGRVDLGQFHYPIATFLFLGTLQGTLSATGEELGWRGFLVPALAERMSFTATAIVSGVIWTAWHVPLIVFGGYNAGTSTLYAILCFAVMVVSISFPMAWLRLRSDSVWPCALLHGSHNLFIQAFFDRVTVDTGITRWLTTEFGAALAITGAITAWLFWRQRAAVERDDSSTHGDEDRLWQTCRSPVVTSSPS